ncbi:MAG: hypothetical protein B7Z02_00840 [Rhodobacterales bacterium 32-67-9]|nr:MAG: hypothetical protein B7Z02_00840 [Rhodobacterales bacterium 32-67-9]
MPRQNRVTPEGEIIADPARGLFMGNRGVLHDDAGNIIAPFRHTNWVCCVTAFKNRKRDLMAPGLYTELFFLDEAVALAAGHRPCGECRRTDYARFRTAWAAATGAGLPAPKEMDRALQAARIVPRKRTQVTYTVQPAGLPDGTFVRISGRPALILGDRVLPWNPGGYGAPLERPATGEVQVLTPRPTVAALAFGYRPILHVSAGAG